MEGIERYEVVPDEDDEGCHQAMRMMKYDAIRRTQTKSDALADEGCHRVAISGDLRGNLTNLSAI